MPGMQQAFITGANAKIKLFNKTMAYATDVSYNVTVQTIPIESMGKYEVHANEPVGYSVDGTFSVIRYTYKAQLSRVQDASLTGNSPVWIGNNAAGADNAFDHLNPQGILVSKTFDLEIYQKIAVGTAAVGTATGNANAADDIPVTRVRYCRLTRRGMSLNKRGVMVDNYAFVGIYLDDTDSNNAGIVGPSGQEDLQ